MPTPTWPRWRARRSAWPRPTSSALDAELQAALLPRDPDDARNAFLEIRAGTGGDESALFAADLRACTCATAERQGWRTEVMSRERSPTSAATRKLVLRVEGDARLRAAEVRIRRPPRAARAGDRDAGPHPHQRLHGRRAARARRGRGDHSSTRPSCASTPSAPAAPAASTSTRPTARSASRTCRPASSPSARTTARSTATRPRRWRCWRRGCARRSAASAPRRRPPTRKSLIGSGDRSDRIRTYNFPQGRLTDHRINLTLYKLAAILDGDLDEVVAALQAARAAEQLALLESGAHERRPTRRQRRRGAGRGARSSASRGSTRSCCWRTCSGARAPGCWRTTTRRSTAAAAAAADALFARRAAGEPLAYLVGEKEFHGLMLQVDARVLVPRPDTETLVDWALELLQPNCARSRDRGRRPRHRQRRDRAGGEARAARAPRCSATDASAAALARRARQRAAARARRRVRARRLVAAAGRPALSTWRSRNPPYIADGDPHLAALHHEPRARADRRRRRPGGAAPHRRRRRRAPRAGGWLLLEHGYDQADAVAALLQRGRLRRRRNAARDLAGTPRCTGGRCHGRRYADAPAIRGQATQRDRHRDAIDGSDRRHTRRATGVA